MVNPILVALDMADLVAARGLAVEVREHVGGYKIGLELLMAAGPTALDEIVSLGLPVFADVKLHDIPNTVRQASARLADHGVRWITVHASGGAAMIEAAVEGMKATADESGVLAVTVLTSFNEAELAEVGLRRSIEEQAVNMAAIAGGSKAEGVICSPHEAAAIKSLDLGLKVVTPGIRPERSEVHDQKRVMTAADALMAGADLLVIGRAITNSADPAASAAAIASEVATLESR